MARKQRAEVRPKITPSKSTPPKKEPKTRREVHAAIRGHLEELAVEVDATKRDAGFTKVLQTMAQFWTYSPFNQCLIHIGVPRATLVASASRWLRLGRSPPDSAPTDIPSWMRQRLASTAGPEPSCGGPRRFSWRRTSMFWISRAELGIGYGLKGS